MGNEAEAPSVQQTIRARLKEAAPGPGAVTDAVDAAVSQTLQSVLRGTSDESALSFVEQAMAGVVEAAKDLSAPIWHAARGALVGALRAAQGTALAPEDVVREACSKLIRASDEIGGDFGAAAKGSVEGAILASDELELDEDRLASVAATVSWRTAGERSSAAAERVLHVVTPAVMGIPTRILRE